MSNMVVCVDLSRSGTSSNLRIGFDFNIKSVVTWKKEVDKSNKTMAYEIELEDGGGYRIELQGDEERENNHRTRKILHIGSIGSTHSLECEKTIKK